MSAVAIDTLRFVKKRFGYGMRFPVVTVSDRVV
jgi:hypothetical protein